MAGTASTSLYATVLALRNQYASRASAPKFGYRSASMFPPAVEQTVHRQLVEYDEHDWRSPLQCLQRRRRFRRQKTLLHSWIEKKQYRNDERGGRQRRQELPNGADSTVGERDGDADERAAEAVPWERRERRSFETTASRGLPPGVRRPCRETPRRRARSPLESRARARRAREEVRDK